MKTQNRQQFSIKQLPAIFSLVILGAFVFAAQTPPKKAQTSSGYHLLKTIKIGGEGGWDYIFDDSKAHRLYVSHTTKVVVIDTDKDTIVVCIEQRASESASFNRAGQFCNLVFGK